MGYMAQRSQYLICLCISDVVSILLGHLLTFDSNWRVLLRRGVGMGFVFLFEEWLVLAVGAQMVVLLLSLSGV